MTPLLLALNIALSAPAALATPPCVSTPDGYCTDRTVKVSLKRGQTTQINVLIGHTNTLEIIAPNKTLITKRAVISTQAFKHRFEPEPKSMQIWARTPGRGTSVGQQANVRLTVAGQPVTLNLKVGPTPAVQRVVLDFPELEAERAHEADLRTQIRAKLLAELAADRKNLGQNSRRLAEDQVIDAALKRLKCTKAPARGLDRYLRLTTHRICEFGDWIFVEGILDNIKRSVFELRDISVQGNWDGTGRPLDFKVKWVIAGAKSKPAVLPLKLRFKEAVRGMFLIKPPTDQALPDSYSITIREHGGEKRSVTADDIEF